jgi:TetR/AcrR family fatty acid metabolism transcriptional regulator
MPKIVDKEEKKAKILEAAIKTFSKNGLNNTKISDIAEEAAIGKGTIYEYFKSKDEIFSASFYYFMGKFEEGISLRLFRIHDPLEKLRTYFSAWAEMFEGDYLEYLDIVLDFWAEGVRERNDSLMIDLNKFYSENRDMLDNLLSECVSKGEIKKVDTKLIASIMIGTLDGILLQWVMDRKAFNMKKAILLFVETMIDGLKLTSKSVK